MFQLVLAKKKTQWVAISQLWEFRWLVLNLLLGFGTLHGHKLGVWCSWWRIVPPVHAESINVAGHKTRSTWEKATQCAPVSDHGLDCSSSTLQRPGLGRNLCTVSSSPQTGIHPVLEALLGSAADPGCLESWIWRDGKLQKSGVWWSFFWFFGDFFLCGGSFCFVLFPFGLVWF